MRYCHQKLGIYQVDLEVLLGIAFDQVQSLNETTNFYPDLTIFSCLQYRWFLADNFQQCNE
jgi:hypothetical protein